MVNLANDTLSTVIIGAIAAPGLELTTKVLEDAQLDLRTRGPPKHRVNE